MITKNYNIRKKYFFSTFNNNLHFFKILTKFNIYINKNFV